MTTALEVAEYHDLHPSFEFKTQRDDMHKGLISSFEREKLEITAHVYLDQYQITMGSIQAILSDYQYAPAEVRTQILQELNESLIPRDNMVIDPQKNSYVKFIPTILEFICQAQNADNAKTLREHPEFDPAEFPITHEQKVRIRYLDTFVINTLHNHWSLTFRIKRLEHDISSQI